MATIKTFKDLDSWIKAIELSEYVYYLISKGSFQEDYALLNQIKRAVISIASNISEGFEREGNKEFIQYLSVAKGSAAEVQMQIHIAFEVGHINREEYEEADILCTEILKLLSGFIRYLNSTTIDGNKFKRR